MSRIVYTAINHQIVSPGRATSKLWNSLHCILNISDSESDDAKRRRSRTNFSQWQLEEMERVFQSCHYPDVFMREAMALKLDLKESRISVSLRSMGKSQEYLNWYHCLAKNWKENVDHESKHMLLVNGDAQCLENYSKSLNFQVNYIVDQNMARCRSSTNKTIWPILNDFSMIKLVLEPISLRNLTLKWDILGEFATLCFVVVDCILQVYHLWQIAEQ